MTLYTRAFTLRNCGRFTVIASDFGAEYRTHTHVTSEALHASLTRGATWRAGGELDGQPIYPLVQIKADGYDFEADYDFQALPLWFTPGLFSLETQGRLPDSDLDTGYFNVVHEFYPTTSGKFAFKKGQLASTKRPPHVPTYGMWQGILPDRRLDTFGLAGDPVLLEAFEVGQTFLLGKKRTMVQIVALSEIVSGEEKQGACRTGFLQLPPVDLRHFESFDVLAATMRYLILRGETREDEMYVNFKLRVGHEEVALALPGFFMARTPLGV